MNNKLISYEEAKERLKFLEKSQRLAKAFRNSYKYDCIAKKGLKRGIYRKKKEINLLLSIIHAHKQARKYYGKWKDER